MKATLENIVIFVVIVIMMIASAGALNYGVTNIEHFYTVCGALNLIVAIYVGVKRAKELIGK